MLKICLIIYAEKCLFHKKNGKRGYAYSEKYYAVSIVRF